MHCQVVLSRGTRRVGLSETESEENRKKMYVDLYRNEVALKLNQAGITFGLFMPGIFVFFSS